MGARDGAILRIFFAEGLYIGLLGLAIGIAAGVARLPAARALRPAAAHRRLLHQQAAGGHARERDRRRGGLAALVLCCLATVYPAMLASRMRPVDGLRYE